MDATTLGLIVVTVASLVGLFILYTVYRLGRIDDRRQEDLPQKVYERQLEECDTLPAGYEVSQVPNRSEQIALVRSWDWHSERNAEKFHWRTVYVPPWE